MAMNVTACLSVCLSVFLSVPDVSKNDMSKLHEIFFTCYHMAVARSSCDDSAVRYVLPVLCVTSCFPIIGYMARGSEGV